MSKRSMVVILLVLILVLAACSKNGASTDTKAADTTSKTDATTPDNSASKKLDPVTLKIMLPGDRPSGFDAVIAEAEKRMADTLNVKLDVTFVSWQDVGTKTQVTLNSGEPLDLIWDAPWLHMNKMIADGVYEPLDDLIQKYGADITAARPQAMWDANKFGGKIYAIPLGAFHVQGKGYDIRKDLREKFGMDPIKSYDDLVKYMYAVKDYAQKEKKKIIPFIPIVDPIGGVSAVFQQTRWDKQTFFRTALVGGDTLTFLNPPLI